MATINGKPVRDAASGTASAAYSGYSDFNRGIGASKDSEILGQFKRGNYGKGFFNLAVGTPAWSAASNYFAPGKETFLGGSREALDANRQQYDQGIVAGQQQNAFGQNIATGGALLAGQGANLAQQNAQTANGMVNSGLMLGAQGFRGQNALYGSAIGTAGMNVGSEAEIMQRQAAGALNANMMAQAAAARGGNQASALRSAQAQAAANSQASQQQLDLLRVKEAESKRDAMIQAQQAAAAGYGQQAAQGLNLAGTGLSGAGQAANTVVGAGGTVGGIGSNIMSSGNTAQGNYLTAETDTNKAQAGLNEAYGKRRQDAKGAVLGTITKGIGAIFGG